MTPTVITKGGIMVRGQIYHIWFRADEGHPDAQDVCFVGSWTGQIDSEGMLVLARMENGETVRLHADSFVLVTET